MGESRGAPAPNSSPGPSPPGHKHATETDRWTEGKGRTRTSRCAFPVPTLCGGSSGSSSSSGSQGTGHDLAQALAALSQVGSIARDTAAAAIAAAGAARQATVAANEANFRAHEAVAAAATATRRCSKLGAQHETRSVAAPVIGPTNSIASTASMPGPSSVTPARHPPRPHVRNVSTPATYRDSYRLPPPARLPPPGLATGAAVPPVGEPPTATSPEAEEDDDSGEAARADLALSQVMRQAGELSMAYPLRIDARIRTQRQIHVSHIPRADSSTTACSHSRAVCDSQCALLALHTAVPLTSHAPSLSIHTVDADGSEIHFRLRRTTPLGRLISAYCMRMGLTITPPSVHFYFAGTRITEAQTPADLGIEDGDQINVVRVPTEETQTEHE
jgi:small ubiquitin-related modifier